MLRVAFSDVRERLLLSAFPIGSGTEGLKVEISATVQCPACCFQSLLHAQALMALHVIYYTGGTRSGTQAAECTSQSLLLS